MIVITTVAVIAGIVLYQQRVSMLARQIELQEREVELKESITEQQRASAQEDQAFQEWVNQCILAAQEERDQRKGNLNVLWTDCLSKSSLDKEYCDVSSQQAKASVDAYYRDWEANCKRGIVNTYQNR